MKNNKNLLNIIALEINDRYCASILENGHIKLFNRLNNRHHRYYSFDEVLEEENYLSELRFKNSDCQDRLSSLKKNFVLTISESGLAFMVIFALHFFFNASLPIVGLISKILIGSVGVLTAGMIFDNLTRQYDVKQNIEDLSSKIHLAEEELRQNAMTSEVVFPVLQTIKTKKDKIDAINGSARMLYSFLSRYVTVKMGEPIKSKRLIYLDNPIVSEDEIAISLPLSKEQMEIGNRIVSEANQKMNIHSIREQHFDNIDFGEELNKKSEERGKELVKKYFM